MTDAALSVPVQFIYEMDALLKKYGLTVGGHLFQELTVTAKTHEEPLPTPKADDPPWEEDPFVREEVIRITTAEQFHSEFGRRLAVEIPQAMQPEFAQSQVIYGDSYGLLEIEDLLNYMHYLTASRDGTYNRHIIGLVKTLAQEGGVEKVRDLGRSYLSKRGMAETVRQRDNARLAEDPPPPPVDPTKQRLEKRLRDVLKGGAGL